MWQMVAPDLAASMAESAICLGVTGMAGCLPTVSPAPVMAQVTMTSVFMDGSSWVRLRLQERCCVQAKLD